MRVALSRRDAPRHFLVDTINGIQTSRDWKSTAIIIAYDADGWYDHQMSPTVNRSQSPQDALTGDGLCGTGAPLGGYQDRCGHGPRQPLLVLSPYSRVTAVDHQITDQTSILRFIEDNWLGGQRIGDSFFDALAGSLDGLLDFTPPPPAAALPRPDHRTAPPLTDRNTTARPMPRAGRRLLAGRATAPKLVTSSCREGILGSLRSPRELKELSAGHRTVGRRCLVAAQRVSVS